MQANAPQAPRRHPITVQELFRMGETGVLAPDARIELIEGELIDMALAARGSLSSSDMSLMMCSRLSRWPA